MGTVPLLQPMAGYHDVHSEQNLSGLQCYLETASGVRYYKEAQQNITDWVTYWLSGK